MPDEYWVLFKDKEGNFDYKDFETKKIFDRVRENYLEIKIEGCTKQFCVSSFEAITSQPTAKNYFQNR